MRKFTSGTIIILTIFFTYACNNTGNISDKKSTTDNKIVQESDGTISLYLEKAVCYNDKVDPSSNTAEWNFQVTKPGRYDVWISTLTKDTMNLQYSGSVKVNLLDERLEGIPIGNKIVSDAKDVQYPYYRADSHMGTFYFEAPGEYSIQLISEKVISQAINISQSDNTDHTVLRSVILTPMGH
jgi:hypothetical protein